MAKVAVKKMKKAEEDYRSLIMRHKEAKCEIEKLNGELSEVYTKMRFLEQEVVQANAKIERVSTEKIMMSFHLKNNSQTSPVWDILEEVVHQAVSPKK